MSGDLRDELEAFGLRRVGRMEIKDGEVIANVMEPGEWTGGVYVWVTEDDSGIPVALNYVGRHGALLRRRCREHTYGMDSLKGGVTGQKNAEKIRSVFAGGRIVAIYAKPSTEPRAEELHLISKLGADGTLWNVAGCRSPAEAAALGSASPDAEEPNLLPEDAKRRLAATFDVSPENIEITIRF